MTGRRCVEHRHFSLQSSCGLVAHVPLPIMPQREQVNGGGPKPVSPVFLGEQRAIATRLSGSSNMAPALHHMDWLARLCVCAFLSVCVYVCECGGAWWMPALMQMLAVLKKWEPLSPPLSLLVWKGLLRPSGAGSYLFSSPEGRRARGMHLSSILNFSIIDPVMGKGIYEVMYFFVHGYLLICA